MKFNFQATGIGSVPFTDPKTACRAVFDNFGSIPFWPQLPKRSFLENMYVQFSERLPGLALDEKNKTLHIDTSRVASDIEGVYQKYLDGDCDFFAVSEDHARGFYEFLDQLKGYPKGVEFVKGHITGPISYALLLTDQNKKSIIYDKDLFEVLTKTLSMKARWQIRKLKKLFPNVIIFLDEPYLVSIGSSFINIDIGLALEKFDEIVKAIKDEGALAGVHCCGNTDWSILLKSAIDIINFDAYNFTKEFSLYTADLKNFLQKGATIAWGMVPSSDAIDKETEKTLVKKMREAIRLLTDKGIADNEISSLITSSCGTGTLDEERAGKILRTVKMLSDELGK
ncbi:MAG: methionine synthase [Candidatus Omnitrophota bacterium]|nr:methionine synthase [Candidatus Omnitrophota bacterium]